MNFFRAVRVQSQGGSAGLPCRSYREAVQCPPVTYLIKNLIIGATSVLFVCAYGTAQSPLGLSEVQAPKDNPLTEAKIELGKRMFFDKGMSTNGTVSCASCHDPKQAFAKRGEVISPGVDGKLGRRNSPSLLNVAFAE